MWHRFDWRIYIYSEASSSTLKNRTKGYGLQIFFTLQFMYKTPLKTKHQVYQTQEKWSNIPIAGVEKGNSGYQLFITSCLPQHRITIHICHFHTAILMFMPEIAMLISSIFTKKSLLLLHTLYHNDANCNHIPLPKHIIMKMYISHRGKHLPILTLITKASSYDSVQWLSLQSNPQSHSVGETEPFSSYKTLSNVPKAPLLYSNDIIILLYHRLWSPLTLILHSYNNNLK
jgi:hypothetical protein